MEPVTLSKELIALSADDTVGYIDANRSAIRGMFLQEWDSVEHKRTLELILRTLCSKGFSTQQESGEAVQSFFVHLAYYFKRVNIPAYLTTCYSRITDPYFRLRLEARMKYKKYHDFSEHIQHFDAYLELLSSAQNLVDDGNYNELLNDLDEYVQYAGQGLSEEYNKQLHLLIEDEGLQERFPLLKQFQDRNASAIPGLGVIAYNGIEYEPTPFATALFDEKFLTEIKDKSQPDFPTKLMGYPTSTVISYIIGRGQANFDERFESLEATDRVNLYCYFNMRMHFFSSLSLYERSQIFEKYYNTSGRIHFVDIGCGPATSGIAFADYLNIRSAQPVIFDYYGIDTAVQMLSKADEMLDNSIFPKTNHRSYHNVLQEINPLVFKEAACIIINCSYVFASETLPYEDIAEYLNNLTVIYPYTPVYILYQNVSLEKLNRSYAKFKTLLSKYTLEWTRIEKIKYHNQRNSFWAAKERDVYYEILKLS